SDQVEVLASGADIIVHSAIHPALAPDQGSGFFPHAYHRQSTAVDLCAMAQRARARDLVLTPLLPALAAGLTRALRIPARPLTERDYREAVRDGGFTGQIIVGTDLASMSLPAKETSQTSIGKAST